MRRRCGTGALGSADAADDTIHRLRRAPARPTGRGGALQKPTPKPTPKPKPMPTPMPTGTASSHGPFGKRAPTTVVLRHTMPDGTWHFDWLLLPDADSLPRPDDRVLEGFRVQVRPDELDPGAIAPGQRLEPHRALYLRFEGEIGGGRGHVVRIAAGHVLRCRLGPDDGEACVAWGDWSPGPPRAPEPPEPPEAPGAPVLQPVAYHLHRLDDGWRIAAGASTMP